MTDRARPPLGLGDLLRAVVTLGLDDEQAKIAAIAMGLRPPPRPRTATLRGPESRGGPKPPAKPSIEERPPITPPPDPLTPPQGTELLLERTGTDSEALPAFLFGAEPLGDEAFSESTAALRLPSLFEPAWIRSLVVALLLTETPDGAIDLGRLVTLVSQGRAVMELPRLGRWTLRRGAQVLVDESADMMPFFADAAQICGSIRSLAAGAPVQIVRSDNGSLGLLRTPGDDRSKDPIGTESQALSRVLHDDGDERAYRLPMRGVPIVAITDLGLRAPDRAAEWLRLGLAARRAGCPFVALVPYPRSRWPRVLSRKLTIVPWDRRTRVGLVRRDTRAAARAAS